MPTTDTFLIKDRMEAIYGRALHLPSEIPLETYLSIHTAMRGDNTFDRRFVSELLVTLLMVAGLDPDEFLWKGKSVDTEQTAEAFAKAFAPLVENLVAAQKSALDTLKAKSPRVMNRFETAAATKIDAQAKDVVNTVTTHPDFRKEDMPFIIKAYNEIPRPWKGTAKEKDHADYRTEHQLLMEAFKSVAKVNTQDASTKKPKGFLEAINS